MRVERLERDDVRAATIESLGLDPTWLDLSTSESIAACIRRAASFRCPSPPRTLIASVREVLAGLVDLDQIAEDIEGALERLTSYGDLLELEVESSEGPRRELFLGPPSYILRASGTCLLLGIRPDGASLLTSELQELVEYESHIRRISPGTSRNLADDLDEEGLIQLSIEHWLQAPRPQQPDEVLGGYVARLAVAAEMAEVEGLRLIDTTTSPTYYSGRWRAPRASDNGVFVARRPQAFGADLWCLASISTGSFKLVDLPLGSEIGRGCDVAWRIQAALDAISGQPQRYAIAAGRSDRERVLQFFSPVPSWIQRRLDIVGRPLERGRGALFAYAIADDELEEELGFLRQLMWLEDQPARQEE